MTRLTIKPTDRMHMLVWRAHPSMDDDPGWRVAPAVNRVPIRFPSRFYCWESAMQFALGEADIPPTCDSKRRSFGPDGQDFGARECQLEADHDGPHRDGTSTWGSINERR